MKKGWRYNQYTLFVESKGGTVGRFSMSAHPKAMKKTVDFTENMEEVTVTAYQNRQGDLL